MNKKYRKIRNSRYATSATGSPWNEEVQRPQSSYTYTSSSNEFKPIIKKLPTNKSQVIKKKNACIISKTN